MVAKALRGIYVETCCENTRARVHAEPEGLEYRRGPSHLVSPTGSGGQLKECRPELRRDFPAEMGLLVLADLELNDDPVRSEGLRSELTQKDCLSDSSQPCDDHRLLGAAGRESIQEEINGLDLVVAADDDFRLGTRIGGVRVACGIQ